MRWNRVAAVWLSAVAVAAPVVAQQSLGDVAGSIKLNNTGDEGVVIDQRSVGRSRSTSPALSDAEFLLETTQECVVSAQALSNLLGETGSGNVFYDDGWRARVEATGEQFDQQRDDLALIDAEDRYAAAYDKADRGATAATVGLGILRAAISADRPLFSEAKRELADGARVLESAARDMRAAMRTEQAEAPPPLIDPIAADRSIDAVCGKSFAQGSQGFDGCITEQRAAMNAIIGRSAPGVRLDQATFNKICNNCRYEWPDDFVNRNRCERTRIGTMTR